MLRGIAWPTHDQGSAGTAARAGWPWGASPATVPKSWAAQQQGGTPSPHREGGAGVTASGEPLLVGTMDYGVTFLLLWGYEDMKNWPKGLKQNQDAINVL